MKKITHSLLFLTLQINLASQNNFCLTSAPDLPHFVWSASEIKSRDFNQDGKKDICCFLYSSSSSTPHYGVGVLLALGNGSFSAPAIQTITINRLIKEAEVEDFNNDGLEDIIAIANSSDSIYTLIGTGSGNFSAPNSFSTNGTPISLVNGDFNNDGNLDFAVALNAPNGISIFNGAGNGTFNTPINYSLSVSPNFLVTGDFNNDSKLDLMIASQGGTKFLKNNGSNNFSILTSNTTTFSQMTVVDFNADNKLDLIYVDVNGNKVFTHTGNGNFTFNAPVSYAINWPGSKVNLADLNNDNKLDLVVVSSQHSVSIFAGSSNGVFQTPVTYSIYLPSQVPVLEEFIFQDLNGNGKLDLLALARDLNTPSGGFKLFLNCNTVGLTEDDLTQNAINIFPNPTTGKLNLKSKSNLVNLKIEVYNAIGQSVYSLDTVFGDQQIDLSSLPNGIYFLKLQDGLEQKIFKIIKE